MKTQEIEILLQRYFSGESSREDERTLETYFSSENVADELREYAEFFGGISELAAGIDSPTIEDDIMDFILENEHREKTKFRKMWRTVTGIAASVIIVLGSFLIYEQQQKPFEDTYKDPDKAFAVAAQTLQFVSGKYNKGINELSYFSKLEKATEPMKKGIEPVNEFYKDIRKMEKNPSQQKIKENKSSSNDSI